MRIYVIEPAFYQNRRIRPGMIIEWLGKKPPSWGVENPTHQEVASIEGDLAPRTLHEIQIAPVTVTAGPNDKQIKAAPPAASEAKAAKAQPAGQQKSAAAKTLAPPVNKKPDAKPQVAASPPPVVNDDDDDDDLT